MSPLIYLNLRAPNILFLCLSGSSRSELLPDISSVHTFGVCVGWLATCLRVLIFAGVGLCTFGLSLLPNVSNVSGRACQLMQGPVLMCKSPQKFQQEFSQEREKTHHILTFRNSNCNTFCNWKQTDDDFDQTFEKDLVRERDERRFVRPFHRLPSNSTKQPPSNSTREPPCNTVRQPSSYSTKQSPSHSAR